jgi:hypothetical protein
MRRQGIPAFDVVNLTEPVRRTSIVRWALAAALVATLLAAAWWARDPGASAVRIAQGGESGVVVLDMSASIGSARRRLTEPFEYLADTNQEFGLVLFSSVAYEAIPPGTAATELRGFLRALAPFPNVCMAREFTPCPPNSRRVEPDTAEWERIQRASVTPWAENFRGGTSISTGLKLAREMLDRHGQEDRGALLISDLDDSLLDLPALTRELITYKREGIPLNLVAMAPFDEDRFFFERMVGREAFVDRADLAPSSLVQERKRAERAGVPEGLAGLALILLMLLAANEHFCGRLAWQPERRRKDDEE